MTPQLIRSVTDIATRFRAAIDVSEDNDVKARCLPISRELAATLRRGGYDAAVTQGAFEIDAPDQQAYKDWDEDDFPSAVAMERAMYHPLHYWVEVVSGGRRVLVDVTADQFNDEIEGEEMPRVVVGLYGEWPRYKAARRRYGARS